MSSPPPACLIALAATGPATINGTSFEGSVELAPDAVIAGVTNLSVAKAVGFSYPPTVRCSLRSDRSASGTLSYTVTSAIFGTRSFTGIAPGLGTLSTRAWTASR